MSDFATSSTSSAKSQSPAGTGSLQSGAAPQPVPDSKNDRAPGRPTQTFGRMSSIECKRRLLHILPGLLPTILWFIPHHDPMSWDCLGWLTLVICSIGIGTAIKYRSISRRGETSNPACILGYTVPVFLLLILLPPHPQIGLATLAIISFGDGFATVGGLLLPGPRLPWNKQKSWAGFLCFLTFALPWSAMVYWGESRPAVSFSVALFVGGTATLFAAICESVDSRIDDNIRVGAAAAVGIVTAHFAAAAWL
jgi:dolichol kinase